MNLSYILVTYNKLPYLKKALAELIKNRQKDEEIVVVDGGSKDGTAQYLQELLERGDIDQFVSERDLGPGHAFNKGMLMAKGVLMKSLSDDDTYYYDEIQKCKVFMLENPEIDALGTNGIPDDGKEYRREEDFLLWKKGPYHPFMIAELGLMLRRSSIPVFGLADTSFMFWDGEFTIRLTAGKARLAWYTGIAWRHVSNSSSMNINQKNVWRAESARIRWMYPNLYCRWCHYVPKPIRDTIRFFIPKKRLAPAEALSAPVFLK